MANSVGPERIGPAGPAGQPSGAGPPSAAPQPLGQPIALPVPLLGDRVGGQAGVEEESKVSSDVGEVKGVLTEQQAAEIRDRGRVEAFKKQHDSDKELALAGVEGDYSKLVKGLKFEVQTLYETARAAASSSPRIRDDVTLEGSTMRHRVWGDAVVYAAHEETRKALNDLIDHLSKEGRSEEEITEISLGLLQVYRDVEGDEVLENPGDVVAQALGDELKLRKMQRRVEEFVRDQGTESHEPPAVPPELPPEG